MPVTFDDVKRATNLAKHGYDFADLDVAFFNRATVLPAANDRLLGIGRFEDSIIAVVFKPLGSEAISVISMRDASSKERQLVT